MKKNDITKLQLDHANTCIKLKLELSENLSPISPNPLLDLFDKHQLFDWKTDMPITIFRSESDLFLISVLKDKVFQLYKKHIQLSQLLVNSRECHKNKNYIDSSVENVPVDDLLRGLIGSISEHSKWLTRFARELPGFSFINVDDFMQMVSSGAMLLFGMQTNQFYYNNENHTVISNNYQMSRSRMNKLMGTFKTGLLFEFHFVFKKLCMSENEIALLYPFILTSSNGKSIHSFKNIEIYNQSVSCFKILR